MLSFCLFLPTVGELGCGGSVLSMAEEQVGFFFVFFVLGLWVGHVGLCLGFGGVFV